MLEYVILLLNGSVVLGFPLYKASLMAADTSTGVFKRLHKAARKLCCCITTLKAGAVADCGGDGVVVSEGDAVLLRSALQFRRNALHSCCPQCHGRGCAYCSAATASQNSYPKAAGATLPHAGGTTPPDVDTGEAQGDAARRGGVSATTVVGAAAATAAVGAAGAVGVGALSSSSYTVDAISRADLMSAAATGSAHLAGSAAGAAEAVETAGVGVVGGATGVAEAVVASAGGITGGAAEASAVAGAATGSAASGAAQLLDAIGQILN
jgi:hypothetical protein